jgi:hypothetical protein
MDPVTLIVVPGVLGGLVIALVFIKLRIRRGGAASFDAFARQPLSTDVINISRIRVAGIGGLGLVAMALVVALGVPRIGQTLAVGLVLGTLWAAVLILRRRGEGGPMPSSGRKAGANTTLSIDVRPPARDAEDAGSSDPRSQSHTAVPALVTRIG